jgi:trigger factor
MSALTTSVTELEDSRVRIEVEVDAGDFQKGVDRTARGLASEMKMPGFRKGKVPPQMVIQRIGREAVVEETLRASLPEWYERALLASGINPVGDPKLDVPSVPGAGQPLSFSIEVAVRPKAKLGDYRGLEVGRGEPDVPDEAVDAELERLREGFASLRPVEREAATGDYLLVDYVAKADGEPIEGAEARDFLLELGAEGMLDGFDEALTGAKTGDERTAEITFPEDYRPERLAGTDASFEISVKEVREKQLPEVDDDFASEASEFDTLDELRADIREKVRAALDRQATESFREAAVDAAVERATVEVPEDVVTARATEMWERVERSLTARGIAPEAYLKMQDRSREDVIDEARPDAEQQLKREAVLAAVAEAEGIEVSDGELIESLAHAAEHEGVKPAKLLERLRSSGRDGLLREDLMLRKAADVLADSAKPIPLETAQAREQIWTPEKERDEKSGSLWTPGSVESPAGGPAASGEPPADSGGRPEGDKS